MSNGEGFGAGTALGALLLGALDGTSSPFASASSFLFALVTARAYRSPVDRQRISSSPRDDERKRTHHTRCTSS